MGSRSPPVVGALELARVPSVNRHVVLGQAAHLEENELSQRPVFNQDFQVRCLTTQLFATVQNVSDLAKKIALIYTRSRLEFNNILSPFDSFQSKWRDHIGKVAPDEHFGGE